MARRVGGWLQTLWRDGRTTENDTFTCAHGNEIVKLEPLQDPATMGGWPYSP